MKIKLRKIKYETRNKLSNMSVKPIIIIIQGRT